MKYNEDFWQAIKEMIEGSEFQLTKDHKIVMRKENA